MNIYKTGAQGQWLKAQTDMGKWVRQLKWQTCWVRLVDIGMMGQTAKCVDMGKWVRQLKWQT